MKKLAVVLLISICLGCGLPKNLRLAENKDSSVIGISIRTVTLKFIWTRPEVVYFVKLDEKDEENLGTKIIPSNFSRGGYAYLINARPGRYAAVASFFTQTDNSYNTFYDANIIKNTIIDVGPGQLAYAGELEIENQMKNLYQNVEQNGDRHQLHYYNLLKTFMYGTTYCGNLLKSQRSKESEHEFMVKTKIYFKDSEWIPLIDKALDSSQK